MSHPRWPGFDHKTGNPPADNAVRNMNRSMWRDTQQRLQVTAAGRKAKKRILRVEGGRYTRLVASVTRNIAEQRAAERQAAEAAHG
jgi:hypothetical protein